MRFGVGTAVCLKGASAATFDPASLPWKVWNRASYSGAPWAGTASAGTSGSASLQDLAAVGVGVGAAVNGLTPATFVAASGDRLYGPANNAVWGASAGCIVVLAKAATAGADAANTVGVRGLVSVSASGVFQMGHSTAGLRVSLYDGAYQEVPAIAVGAGSWFLAAARYNGSVVQASLNGSAFASASIAAGLPTLDATATFWGASQAADSFDGDLLEVMAGDFVMTDTDVANIKSYVNTRYGLAL